MSKKQIWAVVGIVVVALTLVGLGKAGVIGKKNSGTEVEVQTVEKGMIVETVSASGKIMPETEVKIAPEVSGEIIKLTVKDGDEVKKGDLLVQINPDIYQSIMNRAQATLQQAKSAQQQSKARFLEAELDYNRSKTLYETKTIPKAEWDTKRTTYNVARLDMEAAQYSVQSAEASLKESRDNLNRTTIYAPIDGTISKLNVEEGERVVGTAQMAGTELLRVANLDLMEVEVDVNENDIVKVSMNDNVDIEVDAYLGKVFEGVVTEIANSAELAGTSADQVTNFKVKIRIEQDSYNELVEERQLKHTPFRPGMTATVEIKTEERSDIVIVPLKAVTTRSDKDKRGGKSDKGETEEDTDDAGDKTETKADESYEVVYVIDNGTAKEVKVSTGIQDDQNIELVSGLEGGEELIVGPYNTVTRKLKDGKEVSVKEEEEETNNDEDEEESA